MTYSAFSDRGRTRTFNPQSRNLIFYPLNYAANFCKSTSQILNKQTKLKSSSKKRFIERFCTLWIEKEMASME